MKTALPPLVAAAPAPAVVPPAASAAERLAAFMRPGSLALTALPPLSLYVHLPWCLKKCPYCDFNSHEMALASPGGETVSGRAAGGSGGVPEARYLDALRADL